MQKGMLTLLALATALSMSLWGCGSNRDSDSSNVSPTVDIESAARVGNCTICHTVDVHTFDSSIAGQNPDLQGLGSAIEHNCESCHGGGQYHHGEGPIPFPSPTAERCGVCHEGTENVPASAHAAMSCSGCHNSLQKETLQTAEGNVICAQCHDGATTAEEPFAGEIYTRFMSSRHANQSARTSFCSACHSHEGGMELLAMERQTSVQGLEEVYNEETVADVWMLPVGSDTIDGVMKKTCATCHDQHATTLRGDGDITAAMLGETGTTTEEATVVYSAEFNLCTACHTVDLTPTKTETAGAGYLLYDYELSDKYTAANLINATTGTYNFGGVMQDANGDTLTDANGDPLYHPNNRPFYHDGASGNGRTMVDTHFGGKILSHLVDFAGGNTDIEIKGYNINPGNPDACTICHDPHTAGKMLAESSSTGLTGYPDVLENEVVGYAEGLGDFHTNYKSTVAYRQSGCTPCHTGDTSFAQYTEGLAVDQIDDTWKVLGCRGCHDLAQENTEPGTNDSAAFAAVREFPADHLFEFESGVEVDVAELGVDQVCFECHKGRNGVKDTAATTTEVYGVTYFHYAPSFAVLFGDDSEMAPTYEGKSYAGRFMHPNDGITFGTEATPFGCVDCHDVHNTAGNDAVKSRMINPDYECSNCHTEAGAANLKARTVAFGQRLLDTIVKVYNTDNGTALTVEEIEDIINARGAASDIGSNKLAKAASIYKIFNYEDGSPHGTTHGHGGSWAHNSVFARQLMYDAIEDLGGDLTGLARP